METQFQYIISLSKQYHEYSEQNGKLFSAINSLPQDLIEDIFKEYGDENRNFKPVNLLRA